jgi:CRISPR-associated protein Cas1
MSNLYLYDQGSSMTYKNNRVNIKDKENCTRSIPIESIDSMVLFGGVNLSTACIKEFLKRGISVTWLSKNGSYYGRLESTNHTSITKQRLQFEKSSNEKFKLEISKRFIIGKTTNQRTILQRYNRIESNKNLKEYIKRILYLISKIDEVEDIEELLGIEGQIAKVYYKGLNEILIEDFKFNKRSRRPPLDPVNATLSFGYTLLLYEIFTAVTIKGINPYCGFLHKDRENHPALCSDLLEEWRPILVDSLAVALLNSGKLNLDHFENRDGVFLSKEGINIFIREFEKRLRQEVKYKSTVPHKMSFRRIVEYQVKELIDSLKQENADIYNPVLIR